jgi:CRP-like cAMP-binding protein
MALDRERLEGIKEYFGDRAEIVAAVPAIGKKRRTEALITSVLDMVRRRPLRQVDIANSLGLSQEETNDLIKGLIIKGFIRKQQHVGDTYYLSNENERR